MNMQIYIAPLRWGPRAMDIRTYIRTDGHFLPGLLINYNTAVYYASYVSMIIIKHSFNYKAQNYSQFLNGAGMG